MAHILGLDLGSHTVKAVLFETTLRGYQTKAYATARRGETLQGTLTELFARAPLRADQVVIALPGPALATHLVTLPFTDAKRVEATLPFEIESQLPFDLSEVVFDYQLGVQQERKSDLVVGVVRIAELKALLGSLQEVKVDPRIVTHPAVAYQNLLSTMAPPEAVQGAAAADETVAILDLGHERTSVAIGRLGGPVELARTFAGGGKDLSRLLANEFQVSFEEADRWKEAHGAVGEAAIGADAQRAAATFVRGLQPLLRELRPTFKAHTARARSSVSRVFLCGGTSRLLGLDEQLSRDLGVPVERLRLPLESEAAVPSEEQPVAAQAYALALRGQASGAKAPRLNFRKGELAFKGDYDYLREKVGLLASFAAILFILLIASGIVRSSVLARRERQVDAMLCDVTQKVLGACEKNYDRALNLLQGKESPAAEIPQTSAVTLLAELTQRLPTDIPVTVDQIAVDLDRITVRIETDSSKQVDKITAALKSYKCFKEVKEGKVEKSRDGSKVTFRLDVQVECPDSRPQG